MFMHASELKNTYGTMMGISYVVWIKHVRSDRASYIHSLINVTENGDRLECLSPFSVTDECCLHVAFEACPQCGGEQWLE